jgi:hypothetical protein
MYHARMPWLRAHYFAIGILADSFTFLGGLLLARDAFLRLRELQRKRIDQEFRRQFPRLNLTDDEWQAAVVSVAWSLGGFLLMVLGFLCQLLLRLAEP